MKNEKKLHNTFINFIKEKFNIKYIKVILMNVSAISIIISISYGAYIITKLMNAGEKKRDIITFEHAAIENNNDIMYSYITDGNNKNNFISNNEVTEPNINNEELPKVLYNDLEEIISRIEKIDDTTVSIKKDTEMLNNKIEDNNFENVFAAIITGIFSMIVPLLSLVVQIIIYKREKIPQSIIIEEYHNKVYMELRKISNRDRVMDNENILLVNENKYEVIKIIERGKKFYMSKEA